MKKISLKWKFLLSLFIVIFIFICGYLYVSLIFVPYKLKNILATKAEEFLHRKVTLESIDINLVKGITVKNFAIADKSDDKKPFISLKEVTFKILFAPIFKNKVILIPSIKIYSPDITIVRTNETRWNFSDLLPQSSSKEQEKDNYQFALQKLIIEDGTIHFTDQSKSQPYNETLDQLHIEASVSLSQKVQIELDGQLINHHSPIQLKGEYEIPSQNAEAKLSVKNIYLNEYASLFLDEKTNPLKGGIINLTDLKINHTAAKTEASGMIELSQTKLIPAPNQIIEGNFNLPQFSAVYADGSISLQGDVKIQDLNVNVPPLTVIQANMESTIDALNVSGDTVNFKGNLISKNLKMKSAPDMAVTADVELSKLNISKNNNGVVIQGNFVLDKSEIQLNANQKLQGDIQFLKTNISLAEDTLKLEGDLSIQHTLAEITQGPQTIQFSGDIKASTLKLLKVKNDFEAQSSLDLSNATVDLGGMTFKDSLSSSFNIKGSILDPGQMQYQGFLQFNDASISGLPTVQSLEHLKGKIDLSTDKATLTSISFNTQDIPVKLSGSISNFAKPFGDLSIAIDTIKLENLTPLIAQFAKDLPVAIAGSADLKADIKGPLTDILSAEINAVSHFSDVKINGDKLPYPVSNMSGELVANKDKAELKDVKLTLLDKEYLINGQVENFKEPSIKGTVASENANVNAEAKMLNEVLQISKLDGKFFNSAFDVSGRVNLPKNQEPIVDLNGKADIDLTDLKNIPQLAEQLKTYNPTGILTIEGIFKGSAKEMKSWNTAFTVTSARVTVMDYPIESINVKFAQSETINPGKLNASAIIYGGKLTSNSTVDITDPTLPINLTAQLERLDLSQFQLDKKTNANNLSGFVSSNVTVNGPIKDLNALQGEGSIVAVEGYLGQLKFFDGILGALLVVPEFKNMLITDASVNFMIQDGRISTDSLLLSSPTIQLKGKGWIDFKNNINIEVSPELSQIELVKSDSAKQLPTQLLSSAISVKCTGIASKPECGLTNTPGKILEGTTDILKEGIKSVGGILQEIF